VGTGFAKKDKLKQEWQSAMKIQRKIILLWWKSRFFPAAAMLRRLRAAVLPQTSV
jgi:hypothetical protein